MYKFEDQSSIKIFLDGPNIDIIKKNLKEIDGYTFNPSLFRKLGVKNYLDFCKEILAIEEKKHISLEVLSDDENTMIKEAIKLSSLADNVWIKIPISFTNGASTINVIKQIKNEVKLNITAIFTFEQIKNIIDVIMDSNTILSVFAGRIYDIGLDANQIIKPISKFVHDNSKCELLWASPRMTYDLFSAKNSNCDIITMPYDLVKKIDIIGTNPMDYSISTVKMFYNDAQAAKYNIV